MSTTLKIPPLQIVFLRAAQPPPPPLKMGAIFRGGLGGEPPLQMVFFEAGLLLQCLVPFVVTD